MGRFSVRSAGIDFRVAGWLFLHRRDDVSLGTVDRDYSVPPRFSSISPSRPPSLRTSAPARELSLL